MADVETPVRRFRAHQILIDMTNAESPAFKIEADKGPVLVTMDRDVLEEFFRQAETIRVGLLKTTEKFEER
jgi:hypothetical protein